MDPLTHSTLGACCAFAVARPGLRRAAALAGVVAGLLPDADVFIRSSSDSLLGVEYHRHFTHSFLFQPVTALLAALVASLLLRFRVPWKSLFIPALVAGLSHILCDAWTSYGTRLWWPFTDTRVAWDMVSIIDPFITLPLLVGLVWALFANQRKPVTVALGWLGIYLTLAIVQRERAEAVVRDVAAQRGHSIDRITAKPSFANILVWRGIYRSGGRYYAVAVRPGLAESKFIEGESVKVLDPSVDLPFLGDNAAQQRDLRRFTHFSDGWVVLMADGTGKVIGDVRYSLLPQRMAPLWGIVLDPQQTKSGAQWINLRVVDKRDPSTLWALIRGEGVTPAPGG